MAVHFAARVLSVIDLTSALKRKERFQQYKNYVNAFKDTNQSVMIESYTVFHASRLFGTDTLATCGMSPEQIEQMMACHAATAAGKRLPDQELRRFYENYFRWE